MSEKFYITTAIDYVNALPHLGHAYEKVTTDVIARYKRLAGAEVWFLTGTDENSLNAERQARELGREPQQYVDEMAAGFRATWQALAVSNDDFVRTTEERHKAAARAFFQRAYDAGDIYTGTYEGYYCDSCEAFYDEDDLAEGGRCPVHEDECDWLSERNYFFALSKYQDRLVQFIEENPDFIKPESRRNEVLAFINRRLQDFSISRASMTWGIPTPIDPEHVIYVWFDALVNYVTGVGFPDNPEMFERYWPCDLHVIGKDIWRFHCIYWPAMLMSAGLPIPKTVFVHGFVTLGGEKMSKSRGIYVDPVSAVEQYGADAIRFFLVREVPFGQDGDFSWEAFVTRYNADLANDLGNLLSRTLNLVSRHFDGKTPPTETIERQEEALAEFAIQARDAYTGAMDRYAINVAVDHAMSLVRETNRYLADTKPWELPKQEELGRMGTILYSAMEALRWASVMVTPAMPSSAERIQVQLGLGDDDHDQNLAALRWGGLRTGQPIGEIEPLFPRLAPKPEAQTDGPQVGPAKEAPEQKEEGETAGMITFDDFQKLDLRVAEVLEAKPIPSADRLLKLRIQLGEEERTLVAGVAEHYTAAEMVGKRIIVVANLQPRTVFGVESQGMLLAATEDSGNVVIAEFPKDVASGSQVS